jgi:spermidine/putrescine transport system substrate-binding protein
MKRWLAATLTATAAASCSGPEQPVLRVLTWANYFAKDTVSGFEREAGCRVAVDYIESSETLRTKLAGGNSGYDVVFPSDEVLAGLIAQGLLEPLDSSKLPNRSNLSKRFVGRDFDPRNAYSLPYMWGTTGIAYHTEKVKPAPESWAALLDPKATMLDDGREVFAALLRLDGEREFTEGALAKALKRAEGWKPLAWESSPKEKLVQGDVVIAQCFSGDALQASEELGGKIGFVIPKEGGTLWMDSLCIAKGAPQATLAHRFIDYLLRPAVSAAITNEMRFPNPNAEALKLVKPELLEDPRVNPGESELARLSWLPPLDAARKKSLDAAWAALKRR